MAITTPHGRHIQASDTHDDGGCPPLENGDRLTRAEFERRYDAMPGLKKAELLDGVVYMPSPVRHGAHSKPHSAIVGWLFYYEANTSGVETGDNGSVRMDDNNEPQPDAYLLIKKEAGGQSAISPDDYIEGAPELAAEVTASSVSYDLGVKLEVYRRNKVQEYLVWRVLDQRIDWFLLRDDHFEPLEPGSDGILRSLVFPGLWLDPDALLRGELTTVFDTLRRGVDSPDHSAFVQYLNERRPAS